MKYELKSMSREVLDTLSTVTIMASPFYPYNKPLDEISEKLIKDLSLKDSPHIMIATKWFVHNVCRTLVNRGKAMSVRLKTGYWKANYCGIGYKGVRSVITAAEAAGLIDIYKGFKPAPGQGEGQCTVVLFKPPLTELLKDMSTELYTNTEEAKLLDDLIIVRDRTTKEVIDNSCIPDLDNKRQQMQTYNDAIADNIKYNGEPIAKIEYFRSFSGDATSGGRLYVHGGGVQSVSQRVRNQLLTIQDESVVELDYSSNHPNILYEYAAQDNPVVKKITGYNFKPYAANLGFVTVDQHMVTLHQIEYKLPEYDPVKNLAKKTLLVCLNAKGKQEAINSVSYAISKDRSKSQGEKEFVGIGLVDTKRVVEALDDHNYIISDKFFIDKGVTLQYIDSEIAMKVIQYMIQSGESILSYHDSFIVRQSAEALLRHAMQAAWKDFLKDDFYCHVAKKVFI